MTSQSAADNRLESIRTQYERGDLDSALSSLEGYLASAPESADGLFLKGVVLSDLGRRAEAETAFKSVLQLDPTLPEAYNNLAVLHAAEGEYQKAIDILKSALGTHPSYHAAFDNLSKLYARLASDAYSRALGVRARAEENIPLVMLRDVERIDVGEEQTATAAPEPAPTPSPSDWQPSDSWTAEQTESLDAPLPTDAEIVEMEMPAADAAETSDLSEAVQAWAEAWSSQDVEEYIAAYASGFVPRDGLSRAEWARQRRERISSPRYIRVSVAFLDASLDSPTTGTIRFLQSYESDRFSDSVTKSLRLVLEGGSWKILDEQVENP